MRITEFPLPEEVIAGLADALWAKMIGSNCDPVDLNLRAKLALEARLLACHSVLINLVPRRQPPTSASSRKRCGIKYNAGT